VFSSKDGVSDIARGSPRIGPVSLSGEAGKTTLQQPGEGTCTQCGVHWRQHLTGHPFQRQTGRRFEQNRELEDHAVTRSRASLNQGPT
jgi:hypothetical protein